MLENHVDIFPWNESFNTGVDEIDHQHKQLVRLLNKVASYISLERSTLDLNTFINELVDYAGYHFATEENYWFSMLPESAHTKQHQDSHNNFIQHVNQLIDEIDSSSEEQWLEQLLSFLASWLASHILESDKYMALLVEAVVSGKALDEATIWADEQMHGTAKETIKIILEAYRNLSANTIRLMREIKAGNHTLHKLSESERSLQQAMNYAKIGRWSFPYNGNVANWSPQMYRLFGLAPETLPGPDSLCRIMIDGYQQPFIDSMQNCFQTGQEHRVEYQITRPNDGELRWIECRGKLLYHLDGKPDRISGFVQDITERKESEKQITQLAYYDSLTLLPNRRLLLDRLNQSIAMSDRTLNYSAVLFIDIDNFKSINDSYGHEYGDILLQKAANSIQYTLRKGDTLARIGGDEFIVILAGLDHKLTEAVTNTRLVANKILHTLSLPYHINNQQFNSSASIGITLFNNNEVSASDLMKYSDIAMYQAKQSGKNSICFYDPLMQKEISTRIELEQELHTAIEKHQFELYYQPQVDDLNITIGCEALIRWLHPTVGLISPDSFVPIAEETGLILPIGNWVLESACKQLKHWQNNELTKHLSLSINVSYRQFRQRDFVDKACELTQRYGVLEGKLKIELTESMLIDDIELTISHMDTLKSHGILLSLDDFGTGYSSLQYLKLLPLSQLKIDRSFVDELETNINDQSIVKTIILMAQALDIEVIAEGVETIEQKNFLANHGCSSYQGYFYSKPIPINEFMSYLTAHEKNATMQTN